MSRLLRRLRCDDSGQSMALFAVMAAGVMSILALAIDLGLLRVARAEAQRAADAAALAGAAEFFQATPATASAVAIPARDTAMSYARRNVIRNILIDSSEVTIQVIVDSMAVHVRIGRPSISLWFARLFGKQTGGVAASATARVRYADKAQCVAPFAVPDMWHDANSDADGDRFWDTGEQWAFGDDAGDFYVRYNNNPSSIPPETGLGSAYRNGNGNGYTDDYGMQVILKVQDPSNAPVSGFFYPFQIPAASTPGANYYRASISSCNSNPVPLNVPIPLEMGNMKGPTQQGVDDLIALDPSATWDLSTNTVINSAFGANWMASPRVKTVPLYDPNQISQIVGGNHNVTFNNFALMFIEGVVQQGSERFVQGRYLYYATGMGGNPGNGAPGSLVRMLQLVE